MQSRIAPSSTEKCIVRLGKSNCILRMLTEEYWKDCSFDPQHGSVDVLPVAEDVEFDVIITEADDVPLLQVAGH